MSKKNTIKSRNGENRFFWFAIGLSAFIGAGFAALLFAMTQVSQPTEASVVSTAPYSLPLAIPPDQPRQLANFSLIDQSGYAVTREDLNGKFLVVGFVFTSCSTTCPIVSRQMETIQQLTTNQPDVRLVTLTVDPEDDTAPVLAKYGRRFNADTNRWCFLTGNEDMIQNVVGSILERDTNGPYAYLSGNFAHSDYIALVDPQGRVRSYFEGLDARAPEAVVKEIEQLRKQK